MSEQDGYCFNGMICQDGCPCASADGICHCPMLDDDKCACNGHCQAQHPEQKSESSEDFLPTLTFVLPIKGFVKNLVTGNSSRFQHPYPMVSHG